jgi:hypothetical protein
MNCVVAERYSTAVLQYPRYYSRGGGLRGRAARVAEALGTPAAGLRPRPARGKVFLLISCLIRLIHLLSLNREDHLTPKQGLDLIPKPSPNGPPSPLGP